MSKYALSRPLDVAEYQTTEKFRSLDQHLCVCYEDTREMVATVGPPGDQLSLDYGLLFAAAPDLLAALEWIVADWDSTPLNFYVPDEINVDDHWEAARAAIAKAKGESP